MQTSLILAPAKKPCPSFRCADRRIAKCRITDFDRAFELRHIYIKRRPVKGSAPVAKAIFYDLVHSHRTHICAVPQQRIVIFSKDPYVSRCHIYVPGDLIHWITPVRSSDAVVPPPRGWNNTGHTAAGTLRIPQVLHPFYKKLLCTEIVKHLLAGEAGISCPGRFFAHCVRCHRVKAAGCHRGDRHMLNAIDDRITCVKYASVLKIIA